MDFGRRILDITLTVMIVAIVVTNGDKFGMAVRAGADAYAKAVGALYGPAAA